MYHAALCHGQLCLFIVNFKKFFRVHILLLWVLIHASRERQVLINLVFKETVNETNCLVSIYPSQQVSECEDLLLKEYKLVAMLSILSPSFYLLLQFKVSLQNPSKFVLHVNSCKVLDRFLLNE